MKAYRAAGALRAGMILMTATALRAAAGLEPAAAAPANADSATPPKPSVVAPAAPAAQANTPLNTAEVLKLAEAGVSKDVMVSFIQSSAAVSKPSAKDLITLKEHGVPDEVTLALLKRGSESSQARINLSAAEAARLLGAGGHGGRLDPEGYDYFQHYYLFPRTLSWTYDQLGYYRSPYWSPYSGYWR